MHLVRSSWSLGTADRLHINREKMICSILLLLSLTSCVSGTLVMKMPQTSYQAKENHEITLEWMFEPNGSPDDLIIYCEKLPDPHPYVLFHLHEGVEVPESQDELFAGRVQFDKDVLGDGRLRLHMSRLGTDDSGEYVCQVFTDHGMNSGKLSLNITAAAASRPTVTPKNLVQGVVSYQDEGLSQGLVGLYLGLAVSAAALVVVSAERLIFVYFCATKSTKKEQKTTSVV